MVKVGWKGPLRNVRSVWLDKWNLIPGDPWQPAIEEALADSETCAVFIGPSGLSPWQNEEMRVGINRRVTDTQQRFQGADAL